MFVNELNQGRTPQELQQLFVLCLLADGTFAACDIWEEHADIISRNFYHQLAAEEPDAGDLMERAHDMALQSIDEHLGAMGRTLADFDLPVPTGRLTELELYRREHTPHSYAEDANIGSRTRGGSLVS